MQYYNFNDPGYSLLSTLDMTTSPGVGIDVLFNLDQSAATFTRIPFHYLNILVWLFLLLLFPLVFNNMLVCISCIGSSIDGGGGTHHPIPDLWPLVLRTVSHFIWHTVSLICLNKTSPKLSVGLTDICKSEISSS